MHHLGRAKICSVEGSERGQKGDVIFQHDSYSLGRFCYLPQPSSVLLIQNGRIFSTWSHLVAENTPVLQAILGYY